MSAVWLWARRDLRRRWRSVVALALLAALAGGVAMAAATGARRSRVVIAETLKERRQPDAMSIPARPGTDWSQVVRRPYVESYGLFASTALCVRERGGLKTAAFCAQPPVRGGWFDSIARVDVREGRMARRPDELIVNRTAQRRFGLRVGQVIHLEGIAKHRPLAVPESLGPLDDYWNTRPRGSRPWGPTFAMKVVGVYEGGDAERLLAGGDEGPSLQLPLSFMRAHAGELDYRVDAYLRLRGGEADVGRLTHDVARLMGPAVPVTNVHDARHRVERSTLMESAALWAVAVAVAAAALVLVGQALARLVQARAVDVPSLRGVGMARRELVSALAAPGLAVALLAALGAPLVALAASPAVPIGLARSFDRHPGIHADVLVLALGTLATLVALALVAFGAARFAASAVGRAQATSGTRLRGRRFPLPVALGAGWALDSRRGAVATRSALLSVVVAAAAALAAFTVRAGIGDALAQPARAGKVWDLVVSAPDHSYETFFLRDDDVARVSRFRSHIVPLGGQPVRGYVATPVVDSVEPLVVEGRLPRRANEVALGPATAKDLGVDVGDTVRAGRLTARVVGELFLPNLGGHESYAEGAWLTESGLRRVGGGPADSENYFVVLHDDADAAAFGARVRRAGGIVETVQVVDPAGIVNLQNVRGLPLVLAAFFALLGTAAVGHVLTTGLRRRRRDLAILRALGMSRAQVRVVAVAQASTLALAGAVLGIPLGILAGQLAWRWVATSMPLDYVAPAATGAALLMIPASVALANAVTAWPARAAARGKPASSLRVE